MSPWRPVFIGWPNEGIEYWNGYWRRRAGEGFFDDICPCSFPEPPE